MKNTRRLLQKGEKKDKGGGKDLRKQIENWGKTKSLYRMAIWKMKKFRALSIRKNNV